LETIHNEIVELLRGVILAGYSCQWAEFDKFLKICERMSKVLNAKNVAVPTKPQEYADIDIRKVPGLEFAQGSSWVAMSGTDWQKTYQDSADGDYVRSLYRNAMAPNVFGWDDFGAGTSEVQSGQTNTLDYTAYPTH